MFGPIGNLYGGEYCILPVVSLAYLYFVGNFSVPATLINNTFITAANGGAALWRSRVLARQVPPGRQRRDRLEPLWPGLMGLLLLFLAALQLILAVTHISWYRNGPLISDMFET